MKKTGMLNSELMRVLTALRHMDAIAILGADMPLPAGCAEIDLALVRGIPAFMDVVKAVLNEVVIEKFSVFEPMKRENIEMYNALCMLMPIQKKGEIAKEDFAQELRKAKACVRTAEYAAGCNVVLYAASGQDKDYAMYNITC